VLQQLDTAIAFVVLMLMLSLLVTAIVQAISALFDFRGKNLVRALADLFKQIDPGLRATAQRDIKAWLTHPFTDMTLATQLADAVATHPILAHTYTRAKAIRKEELLDVLKDLCSAQPNGKVDPTVQSKLKAILASAVPGASGTMSALEAGIDKWFDSVMDRASDIFTRWTRTITIVFSAFFVLILQIDAGAILQQISMSPDVRAELNKISDAALSRTDEVMREGNRGSKALQKFIEDHKVGISATTLDASPLLPTCAEAKMWLAQNAPKDNNAQFQEEFTSFCRNQAAADLKASQQEINDIRVALSKTGLSLVPDGLFGDKKGFGNRLSAWGNLYGSSPRHILGALAMVVLLSLGAPFWYNALKQLSNLKPAITQKVAKESSST